MSRSAAVAELRSFGPLRMTIAEIQSLLDHNAEDPDYLRASKLLEHEPDDNVFDALFPLATRRPSDAPVWPAAVLLFRRKPRCRKLCAQAVRELLDCWDVSLEEVPFYLVSQFGAEGVREAIVQIRETELTHAQTSRLETVEYWVAMWEIWDVGNPNAESVALDSAKRDNPDLFKSVAAAMISHDPIGIYPRKNAGECKAAATVIPQLKKCSSEAEVANLLHQEFMRWFGWKRAGERTQYVALASDIWKLWTEAKAEPVAAPNGGPPTPLGNSGVTKGPPSVS